MSTEPNRGREVGSGAVALLLAAAAIVAAVVAARASFISSEASGNWQSAVRTEVKRAPGAVEDIRFLYQSEAGVAFGIAQARLLEAELRTAAEAQQGAVQDALLREADVQAGIRLTSTTIPLGIAVLLGAVAQGFAGRRRELLIAAWIALAVGTLPALFVEVLA